MLPVDAVGGAEAGEVGVDEVGVVEDGGADADEFIELGEEELAVDVEGEVVGAVVGAQVAVDEVDEAGEVGAFEAGEEFVEAVVGEGGGVEPVEGGVFEAFEAVGVIGQGTLGEGGAADEGGIEGGGEGALLVEGFALVVEGEVEAEGEEIEGFLVVGVVGEEGLAVFELAEAGVGAVGIAARPIGRPFAGLW